MGDTAPETFSLFVLMHLSSEQSCSCQNSPRVTNVIAGCPWEIITMRDAHDLQQEGGIVCAKARDTRRTPENISGICAVIHLQNLPEKLVPAQGQQKCSQDFEKVTQGIFCSRNVGWCDHLKSSLIYVM